MLQFFSLKQEAFGLDISDLSLKIVKLKKKKGKIYLASFLEKEIEPGIIEGGEIKDEEKLSKIVKEAVKNVKGEKLKTNYVVCSLPEEKSFLQVIQMPKMTEDELKSAILFEAENYIPLPVDQVYLDFQVITPIFHNSEKLDILIGAVPRKIADSYLSALKKAKLEPIAFEIESQAIARALIRNETTTYPILIIDLGATRTSFIIFAGRSIRFTCSIPVSGNSLTEAIAKSLNISFEEAENLKKKYGLGEKIEIEFKREKIEFRKQKGTLFEILIPPLVDLVQQIKRYLDFYETHAQTIGSLSNEKRIKEIILSGGGANLKGLLEFLNLELKIPVKLGSPWVNICEKAPLDVRKSLSLTCAIGLAKRGI